MFSIYINELPDGINSLCKIFAYDASLFSMVYDINKSVSELNAEVEKISYLAYQWKMQFNPDPNKHANEIFSLENQAQTTYRIHDNDISKCPHYKNTYELF